MALIAIIPRHLRILGALIERRKIDQFGAIGWRGLMDDPETFTMDQLFKPLRDRGLVEDLSAEMGNGGTYFVRITKLGQFCYGIGYMLKDPRPTTEAEIRKYITELPRPSTFTGNTIAEVADKMLDSQRKAIEHDHVEGLA
jgi:hypothetical protein